MFRVPFFESWINWPTAIGIGISSGKLMAWIANRARRVEMMDKECMIFEKKYGSLDRPKD